MARTIEESLTTLLPLSRLHEAYDESAATWAKLNEIGIFSIGVSEELGGSNLGAAEESLIVFELGRHLASPAVLATIGATHAPHRHSHAAGTAVAAAYENASGRFVVNGHGKDLALLRTRNGAQLRKFEPGAAPRAEGHLWHADIRETSMPDALAEFDANQTLRLRLIDAAYLAGIAQAALDMSVAYALSREQFGRPIGSFQAIKHHCANMASAARGARDLATFAAVAIDEGRSEAAFQIESALYISGVASTDNAAKNVQIHGGLGFSDEADPHLLVKRARLQLAIAGGLEAANQRVADAPVPG